MHTYNITIKHQLHDLRLIFLRSFKILIILLLYKTYYYNILLEYLKNIYKKIDISKPIFDKADCSIYNMNTCD